MGWIDNMLRLISVYAFYDIQVEHNEKFIDF